MTFPNPTMPSLSAMLPPQFSAAGAPSPAMNGGQFPQSAPAAPQFQGYLQPPAPVHYSAANQGYGAPPAPPAPVAPAAPQFQGYPQPPSQQNQYNPAAIPAPVPSAPFGGTATPPPGLPAPAGGSGLQNQYVQTLEAQNRIERGQFKSDAELIERLYSLSEDLAGQLESPAVAPPVVSAPVVPASPTVPSVDYSSIVPVFQQQGWLGMQGGQWVAANPIAAEAANHMNQQMFRAQQVQAEIAGNPQAFVQKYGQEAFTAQLTPFQEQLRQLSEDNKRLTEMVQQNAPKPHLDWVRANDAVLWAADQNGNRTPTQAGAAYRDAWNLAHESGVSDDGRKHQIAAMAVKPYLGQAAPQSPPQSWMQSVNMNQPVDSGFTAPGSMFRQPSQPPIQTDAQGFPTFGAIAASLNRGV